MSLQEMFVRMSEKKDSGWLAGLFASHPPSQERVDANRRHAAKYPAGGEMGTESFTAAMAQTMKAKPAYDAYDEGRKALKDKKPEIALAKADQAIKLVPGEGHFHALERRRLPAAKTTAGRERRHIPTRSRGTTGFSTTTCSGD